MTAPAASSDPRDPTHVPAATYDLLLPLYDPLLKRLMRDQETRIPMLERAGIGAGHHVLDIGCGTGAMTLLVKLREPAAHVYGLDPNPNALARALGKSREAGFPLKVYRGRSQRLPFPTESIDRVLSALMIHRLTRDQKLATFREVHRVLYAEGSLHVLDFGPQFTRYERALSRVIHRGARKRENLNGELPALMEAAGLLRARETASVSTALGRVSVYEAFRT